MSSTRKRKAEVHETLSGYAYLTIENLGGRSKMYHSREMLMEAFGSGRGIEIKHPIKGQPDKILVRTYGLDMGDLN